MNTPSEESHFVQNPADYSDVVGAVAFTNRRFVHNTVSAAKQWKHAGNRCNLKTRRTLYAYADALELALPEFVALIVS